MNAPAFALPAPLADSAALREWAADRIRFGHAAARWLPVEERGRYWLVNRETPSKWSRDRRPRETWCEITRELHDRLAAKWPRQRNQGLSYLTAAGVADLLGQGTAAKTEGKRRKALDDARWARRSELERVAERAFEDLEGVPALEAAPEHTHAAGRAGLYPWRSGPCAACERAAAARTRAGRAAAAWMSTPLPQLDGRTPDSVAYENDEGLARALFVLAGVEVGR